MVQQLNQTDPGGRIAKLDPSVQITVRDHVHRILRAAIVGGKFAPDEKINERQLAEQFGVSTTPIKEALRQLESEGLVQTLPRRGVIIRFNMGWAEEMILARAALESMIGHLAAKRVSDEACQALQATVRLMETATISGNADELIALNETFHEQIHRASRCEYLARLIERQRALGEHRAIAEAIVERNPDRAERSMRDHVVRSGDIYLAIVFGKKEDI